MTISRSAIMNGCQRFTPNPWKPDVCSDCLRSRATHSTASEHAVTGRPDQSACGPESDTAPQYDNMPLTDSTDKKRSSLKKKFNSLLRGSEKAPVPAPRRGFTEAPDISAPIPIQLDASGKFKSESSFDSVSSLDAEAHSVGDELAIPGDDRPYEEVFYEGDPDRHEAAGNTQHRVAELSVDDQPCPTESPAAPNAEDITISVPPLPHVPTNGSRPVVEINGYSELDLDDFDGPALLTSPTVLASGEESQPMDTLEECQPRDPPEESQPADPPKVKPPLKAKPKINVASQAANRRVPPPPPPPYSKKPSLTSEERGRENGSGSVKVDTEKVTGSSPHTELPPDLSPGIAPRPRRRSKTVGSDVTRRRPPPAPPGKEGLDIHFLLPTPSPSRDDGDRTTDVPPSKPARSRARTVHTRTPGLSPVIPTRSPPDRPVRSTSPHSNSSIEPHHASHSPTHSPVPAPLENAATASASTVKETSPALKRKNSFSSKMKHKFGFRSNSKAAKSSELVVAVRVDEEEQKKDQGDQEVGEIEKKGKIRKLFRKRSKTFSAQKKPAHIVANIVSRDDSSVNFKGTNGLSSLSVRHTQSPEASHLNSAHTSHNTTAEMTEDNSHEYAECGEPLLSKQSPLAAEQETSSSHSGGNRLGVSVCSVSAHSAEDGSSMCSEFLASLQPETIPIDPLIITVGQLQTLMAESINDATKKVSSLYKKLYTPPSSIKCTWDDCTPVSDWPAVVVQGKTCAVLVMDEGQWEVEEEMSSCLPPHPHIVRRLAVMSDPPPFPICGIPTPQGKCVYVLTNAATNVCLKDFLAHQRSRLSQEKFERLVCLVLLQLFLALHHLHRHGVVHRNLTTKTILINPDNYHLQLSDYTYALHKKGTFVYAAQEVKLLGEEDSCLPPEIANNSSTAQELNYSGTDVFEAGCLIYQLLGQENPFESEPGLIHSYTMADLPPLPPFSPYSLHLQRIAHLLLVPDPQNRISAATSLQVLSCLLWLPHAWITQPVPESHVQSFLIYEKTRLVSDLAEMWIKQSARAPSLEELLKSSFFTLMSTSQILKSLESYSHEIASFR